MRIYFSFSIMLAEAFNAKAMECKKHKLCYGTASKKDLPSRFLPWGLNRSSSSLCSSTLVQCLGVLFPQTFPPHYTASELENTDINCLSFIEQECHALQLAKKWGGHSFFFQLTSHYPAVQCIGAPSLLKSSASSSIILPCLLLAKSVPTPFLCSL